MGGAALAGGHGQRPRRRRPALPGGRLNATGAATRSALVEAPGDARVLVGGDPGTAPAEVVRASYRPGLVLAEHAHPKCGVLVVLEGALRESWGGAAHEVGPLGLIFKPADLPHADVYGAGGARCLIVGFDATAIGGTAASPFVLPPSRLAALVVGIGDAARRRSPSLRLCVDELLAEIELHLRCAAPPAAARRGEAPHWLSRVVEAIRCGEVTRLGEAAALAGVHPSYVARVFRARFGRSLGSVARERRLASAVAPVGLGQTPLAGIAQSSGYADQSHLGRDFRRALHTTPGRLRRAARALAAD